MKSTLLIVSLIALQILVAAIANAAAHKMTLEERKDKYVQSLATVSDEDLEKASMQITSAYESANRIGSRTSDHRKMASIYYKAIVKFMCEFHTEVLTFNEIKLAALSAFVFKQYPTLFSMTIEGMLATMEDDVDDIQLELKLEDFSKLLDEFLKFEFSKFDCDPTAEQIDIIAKHQQVWVREQANYYCKKMRSCSKLRKLERAELTTMNDNVAKSKARLKASVTDKSTTAAQDTCLTIKRVIFADSRAADYKMIKLTHEKGIIVKRFFPEDPTSSEISAIQNQLDSSLKKYKRQASKGIKNVYDWMKHNFKEHLDRFVLNWQQTINQLVQLFDSHNQAIALARCKKCAAAFTKEKYDSVKTKIDAFLNVIRATAESVLEDQTSTTSTSTDNVPADHLKAYEKMKLKFEIRLAALIGTMHFELASEFRDMYYDTFHY